MENKPNYHLMVANYDIFNFRDLVNIKENKLVEWRNPGNRTFIKNDMVFIYYCNLPDNTSRIFLSGIIDSVTDDSIFIKSIKGISEEFKNRFTYKELTTKYGIKNVRGHSYLKVDEDDKHKILVDELINIFSDINKYYYLERLSEIYFNHECIIDKNHKLFKKVNGLCYYEEHHFIPRHTSIMNGIDEIIRCKDNLIELCPICHREIHNGTFERRMELVITIYNSRSDSFKNRLKDVINIYDDSKVIEWIFELYLNSAEKRLYHNEIDEC